MREGAARGAESRHCETGSVWSLSCSDPGAHIGEPMGKSRLLIECLFPLAQSARKDKKSHVFKGSLFIRFLALYLDFGVHLVTFFGLTWGCVLVEMCCVLLHLMDVGGCFG